MFCWIRIVLIFLFRLIGSPSLVLPKIYPMRIFLLSLLSFFVIACNNPQEETKIASRHSVSFNSSIRQAMTSYEALTEAFVNWDSTRASADAKQVEAKLAGIKLDEFNNEEKQTAAASLDLAKKDVESMIAATNMEAKRRSLNALTQNLYDFLRAVRYDEKQIYLQECPMAFNDTEAAVWLTDKGKDSIRNPYLGLHHPRYGKGMLDCGDNKSVIDFTKEK